MTSTLIISREQLEILLSGPPGEAYLAAKKELRALLAAPVVESSNKCGRCGASTVEGCNYLGCYFLESGNGAPVVERQKPVAVALPSKRTMGVNTDYNRGVRDYAESVRHSLERQGFKVKELNQ